MDGWTCGRYILPTLAKFSFFRQKLATQEYYQAADDEIYLVK